jgi:hypothetical protein
MAQPAGFFSGGEVERAAEDIFDTMASATVKSDMEAAAEAATAPGALRPMSALRPMVDEFISTSGHAPPHPASTPGMLAYRAEAARRERAIADEQADELFGD